MKKWAILFSHVTDIFRDFPYKQLQLQGSFKYPKKNPHNKLHLERISRDRVPWQIPDQIRAFQCINPSAHDCFHTNQALSCVDTSKISYTKRERISDICDVRRPAPWRRTNDRRQSQTDAMAIKHNQVPDFFRFFCWEFWVEGRELRPDMGCIL